MELTRISENKWHVVHIFVKIFEIFPVGLYILFLYLNNTKIMIGTISMIFMYSQKVSFIFYEFAYNYNKIMKAKAGVLNCEEIEKEFRKEEKKNKKVKLWDKIEIKNLNFSYEEEKNSFTFKNLDFTIKRKEKIALIGKSGSGKTTFFKTSKRTL